MFDDEEIYRDLPFSAEEGWTEMKQLLNKKLPVKKRDTLTAVLACLPVLVLSFVFLLPALQVNRAVFSRPVHTNSLWSATAEQVVMQHQQDAKNIPYKTTALSFNKIPGSNRNEQTNRPDNAMMMQPASRRMHTGSILLPNPANELNQTVTLIPAELLTKDFPMTMIPGHQRRQANNWEWSVGAGVNMAAGEYRNLQPYPVAEIKYALSPSFFVAAGASLFSPAPANVSGVTKTIYVDDTLNNIRLYKQVTDYYHLRYADLPLSAGVKLSRHLSLQAGVQASLLLSKSVKRTLRPYDFNLNSIDTPAQPLAGTPAGSPEEAVIRIRPLDWRVMMALQYEHRTFAAGLLYQYGLTSPDAGNKNGNYNRFLSLRLLYRFK